MVETHAHPRKRTARPRTRVVLPVDAPAGGSINGEISDGLICNAATAPGGAGAVAPARASTALAAMLNVLQDGEIILLILKPSMWFILLSTLRFAAVVLILMIATALLDHHLPGLNRSYQELGTFVLIGRVTWAVLQWMGRLYVLTDMRIVRIGGVFTPTVYDCALRKVARTRVIRSMRERLTGLGSIEILPANESYPIGYWITIARPHEIHEQIVSAINRAKQGGACSPPVAR